MINNFTGKVKKAHSLILANKIIIENYFFMTILQILNSMFYLLIYPFLIKTLGSDVYGLYVFSMSIIMYFMSFVGFGFDFPAIREISQNPDNFQIKSDTLSAVFTAKIYLEAFSTIIFILMAVFIPQINKNWEIYAVLFANTLVNILMPTWYFQGIQKMRLVTYIQVFFKVISLPFIFWLVKSSNDLFIFVIIITIANVIGAVVSHFMIIFNDHIQFKWIAFDVIRKWYKDALPFFWSNAGAILKQQSVAILIGSYFSMSDVALYDLAYKVISIPMVLLGSVNGALFPKIARDNDKEIVKKVILYEAVVGVLSIIAIAMFTPFLIVYFIGANMLPAYPIAVILSFGILTFLIVGSYVNFVFVPRKKYYLVTKNQLVSVVFFILSCTITLVWFKSIYSIILSWSLATFFEIAYCTYLIKVNKLL